MHLDRRSKKTEHDAGCIRLCCQDAKGKTQNRKHVKRTED